VISALKIAIMSVRPHLIHTESHFHEGLANQLFRSLIKGGGTSLCASIDNKMLVPRCPSIIVVPTGVVNYSSVWPDYSSARLTSPPPHCCSHERSNSRCFCIMPLFYPTTPMTPLKIAFTMPSSRSQSPENHYRDNNVRSRY
jgi:hypothetical protein